jgi:uncharacterized membrane protein
MSELVMRFTSLPNLHPALVHFPIALLPVALLVDLMALRFRGQREWLDRAASLLYVASAVGAIAAFWTGRSAAGGLPPLDFQVQLQVNEHSDSARAAAWLVSIVALARVAIAVRDTKLRRKVLRLSLAAIAAGAVALVYRTADLGGGLVYQYGVAVAENDDSGRDGAELVLETETTTDSGSEAADRLVKGNDGSLAWSPRPLDREALGAVLTPAPGTSASAVSWVQPQSGAKGLGLSVDGEALLLLPGAFGDVKVEAELDAGSFEGELGLVHHVVSGSQAGLLTLSFPGGELTLASRDGEVSKRLAKATRALPVNPFRLTVTAAGRHFHGFLDDERVVHGHEPPPGDGGCGLFFRGQGELRILSMTVTPGGA